MIPNRAEYFVPKSHDQQIVDYFLSQIVVNAEDLVFHPIRSKLSLQIPRACKIMTERLFNLTLTISLAS